MIEVRYAGAVVGRAAAVRDVNPQGVFLGVTEPMPVGTELVLKVGDEAIPGKVAGVSESAELARAGMRVQFRDADEAALFGMALASAPAAPLPVAGSASAPTVIPPAASGRVAAAVASGRVVAAAASGRVVAAATPVATGGLAAAPAPEAQDEGEAEPEVRTSAQVSPSGAPPPVPREPEISGPVPSGDGTGASGGGGAGGGQGGGGRKNRRNRRR